MTFKEELEGKVTQYVIDPWGDIPDSRVIPIESDLSYANSGKFLDVTILYADISKSTEMVRSMTPTIVSEYYKAFLHCASRIINKNSGSIQAYDGDRVMAVYVGEDQVDQAVRTGYEIKYAVDQIINPKFNSVYTNAIRLSYTVGIDSGRCLAIKVGVRNSGELTWVGSAANVAAKLNSFNGLDHDYPIRVTKNSFEKMSDALKINSDGSSAWDGPYNDIYPSYHFRSKSFLEF